MKVPGQFSYLRGLFSFELYEPPEARTLNLLIKSQLLYQLS